MSAAVIGSESSRVFLYDTFDGANGTALASHRMNVGSGWSINNGTWTIDNGAAKVSTDGIAFANAGQADVTARVLLTIDGSDNISGMMLRWADGNNHFYCLINGSTGTLGISTTVGGVFSDLGSVAALITAGTWELVAICKGPEVRVRCNGFEKVVTTTNLQQNTRFGIVAGTVASRFHNFRVVA